jgi:hypothetical protein
MLIQITAIEFDFSDTTLSEDSQSKVTKNTIGKVFEIDCEDQISEVVSESNYGWRIKNISYRKLDKSRDEFIEDYVDILVKRMSIKEMQRIIGDQLEEDYSTFETEDLFREILNNCPDLMRN